MILRRRCRPSRRPDGALERLGAVLGDDVLRHAHLDADRDVGVLGDRLGAGVHLREVDVVELGDRERRQADVGDVDEGVEPRARLRHDVAAEGGEVVGARVARRDAGRGALDARPARRPGCRSPSRTG